MKISTTNGIPKLFYLVGIQFDWAGQGSISEKTGWFQTVSGIQYVGNVVHNFNLVSQKSAINTA